MLITKDYMVQLLTMQGYKQCKEDSDIPTMEKRIEGLYMSVNCHERFMCYYLSDKFSMTLHYSEIKKVELSDLGLELMIGNEHSTVLIK